MSRKTFKPAIDFDLTETLPEEGPVRDIVSNGLPVLKEYRQVPTQWVESAPDRPRGSFDPDKMRELESSIREHGIIFPLLVSTVGPSRYRVVTGERRLRAAQNLMLPTVPIFIEEALSEEKIELLQIDENESRENFSPMDLARLVQKSISRSGITREQFAVSRGWSPAKLYRILQLLDLPESIQEYVHTGQLEPSAAIEIRKAPALHQGAMLQKTVQQKLSVRDLQQLRKDFEAAPQERPTLDVESSPHDGDIQGGSSNRTAINVESSPFFVRTDSRERETHAAPPVEVTDSEPPAKITAKITRELLKKIRRRAAQLDQPTVADYVRFLIEQDLKTAERFSSAVSANSGSATPIESRNGEK